MPRNPDNPRDLTNPNAYTLSARISPKLYDQIKEAAERSKRSMAQEIRDRLTFSLDHDPAMMKKAV